MTRLVDVISTADPLAVMARLAVALDSEGPALLPRDALAGRVPAAPSRVPRNVAVVVETSGSTALPKQVALSADALLASVAATAGAIGQGEWVLALPVHYIAGLQVLVRSLAAGTVPRVVPAGSFDPVEFLQTAGRLGSDGRYTSLVPAQLSRLLEVGEEDAASAGILRSFDAILLGGQRAPAELIDRSRALGLRVTRTYGSSETAGGCVYDGVPLAQTQVREIDGQIEIAGPMLAEGYVGDPERTAEAFIVDGGRRWYRTGDTGRVTADVEGVSVEVTGRLDDVFISGGIKVSSADVERVVQSIPGLHGAVVIVVPDREWGHRAVVVADGRLRSARPPLAEVRARVIEELGPAAAPREVRWMESGLARLPSGKVDRRGLAALSDDD